MSIKNPADEDSHPVNLQMPGPSLEKMGKDTSLELFPLGERVQYGAKVIS